jgi:subtilisin family serine protease
MRLAAIIARAAVAAVIALPSAIGISLISSGQAAAQFTNLPSIGGGGGGGHRGGGGGGIEMYDPCAWGDCYERRPRRPYRPGPRVYVVPDDGPPPYVYEEDFGPEPPVRKTKPKTKQVKPKTNQGGQGQDQVASRAFRPDEVLVEIPLSVSESDVDALALQQRIEKLGSQDVTLLNTRIYRWRITDGRLPETVAAALRTDSRVADAHLNRIFSLQQAQASALGGPPQYAAEKLKLDEVHSLTRGESTLVALIDSGADGAHPELDGVVANTFDAIGGTFQPHTHGTGMAGAIAAHAQISGVAPKARILNVRAFAPTGKTNDGTTYDVIRGMDWAAQQGARVFNLSFAGPRDPLMSRVVKAAIDKGIIVVAAAGNAGPKSPPLYPAAETGVIAVTATDAKDGLIAMANRGGYVTIAAPGADILLPAPDKAYSVSSGTSIATAYVSGIVALMIARHPEADAKEIYEVLTGTARDLGAKGRDKEFGAGLADPLAALEAMQPIAQTVSAPTDEVPPVR